MWYKQILTLFYTITHSQVKQKKKKTAVCRLLYAFQLRSATATSFTLVPVGPVMIRPFTFFSA